MKFLACLIGVYALSFMLGFVTPKISGLAEQLTAGVGWAVILAGAVGSVWVTRSRDPLAAAAVLIAAGIAWQVGNYAPYRLGLWGLAMKDYGSDDIAGSTALIVGIFIWSVWALVIGLMLGFLTAIVASRLRPQ